MPGWKCMPGCLEWNHKISLIDAFYENTHTHTHTQCLMLTRTAISAANHKARDHGNIPTRLQHSHLSNPLMSTVDIPMTNSLHRYADKQTDTHTHTHTHTHTQCLMLTRTAISAANHKARDHRNIPTRLHHSHLGNPLLSTVDFAMTSFPHIQFKGPCVEINRQTDTHTHTHTHTLVFVLNNPLLNVYDQFYTP